MKKKKPQVDSSMNGNAFSIISAVSKALKREGYSREVIDKYKEKAKSGDYDYLIRVSMEYVDFV